jgi:hypothetical protein
MRQSRSFAISFALLVFGPLIGCELVADFDRGKIPMPKSDAATPSADAASTEDAGADDDATAARR